MLSDMIVSHAKANIKVKMIHSDMIGISLSRDWNEI